MCSHKTLLRLYEICIADDIRHERLNFITVEDNAVVPKYFRLDG